MRRCVAAVLLLTACAGEPAADAANARSTDGAATRGAPAAPSRRGPVAPLPVRGTVHTVRMVLDGEGYRFTPSHLDVQEGDGVRYIMVSGIPHNVAFDSAFVPAGAAAQLTANLGALGGRGLATPVVTQQDSALVVSFAGLPAGEYLFYCAPHRAYNMHGVVRVRR